jgi:NADH:ubiquinone oxidoreductase subunit K
VMYYMIRGLRRQNINDILLTGLFLGLGLHGYTPFRIVPIFVVLGTLIYILHRPARNKRLQAIFALVLIAFISLVVFIPLLRYWLANPELFAYRAFSRLTGMEVGFQNSPLVIFFQNFWKASIMFFWDNGVIWAHSVPSRPALEVVSGALYFLGIAGLVIRYIRKRNWMDLFLLVSIPLLLMPSILSLAYPGENPSLNRTAGAIVPVFVVIAMAFESTIRAVWERLHGRVGRIAVIITVALLWLWSGSNNYDLVFNQYYNIYLSSSWNTSEIGELAKLFIDTQGSPQKTYLVGYPYWVDSRLVAINAGYPGLDFAIFTEQIPDTLDDPRAKIFFLNVNDEEDMALLQELFPNGTLSRYTSSMKSKDFMIFSVPPSQGALP